MSLDARVRRKIAWFNISTATLITLLQRSPMERIAEAADECVAGSSPGAILRSAVAAAASLGGLDTLAGATVLSSSASSPVIATVGTAITPVAFTLTDTISVGSWTITGSIPPGLTITALGTGASLTASGNLDGVIPAQGDPFGGSNGSYPSTYPELSGTPTTAGTYTFNLSGYQYAEEQGPISGTFPFTVVVGAASVPSAAPIITTAPLSQSVTAGSLVTFTAAASGSPPPAYQWNFDGVAIAGATNSSYAIAGATGATAANIGSYTVTATNSAGSVASAPATLTVTGSVPLPVFTTQPLAVSVVSGSTVVFNAAASGSPKYQWTVNGATIPNAVNPVLVVNGATAASIGSFAAVATNGAGSVMSNAATLSIASTADEGRLVNLSCRALVSSGPNILIGGFVIAGAGTSGSKALLIQAIGPTLAQYAVAGSLPDPQLQLTTTMGAVLASNTGWAGNPEIVSADAAANAGDFPLGSADSALAVTEPAGAYTAMINGAAGDSGIALVAIYDATPAGAFTATTPRLVNLSARAQVGSGSGILIAGFVIGGSTAKTVLIRASGPSLGAFGLSGTIPDPQLVLTTVTGTFIASNAGWGGNPAISTAANSVTAFAWPSLSADSALLVTLPPGPYTAQISGASGDGGLVLAEVYEIP